MKNTDCYFYFEHYDMGAHISCCTFKEYPLGECPCDDCTNYVPQSKVSQIVREYLEHKAIPSAEPKWIPVSEKLPKPNEYVGNVCRYCLIQNEYRDMMVARWDGQGWEQMYQYGEYIEDKVIAWMPLPEPYKAESEE